MRVPIFIDIDRTDNGNSKITARIAIFNEDISEPVRVIATYDFLIDENKSLGDFQQKAASQFIEKFREITQILEIQYLSNDPSSLSNLDQKNGLKVENKKPCGNKA